MVSFVALADSTMLETACAELSAQFAFNKRRRELWLPDEILGIWIGPTSDLELTFAHSFGFTDRWIAIYLDEAGLTRTRLLDLLVAKDIEGAGEPRFIPVFPRVISREERISELARLTRRHAHELRPALTMNPMTGSLCPEQESPATLRRSGRWPRVGGIRCGVERSSSVDSASHD